MTLGSRIWDGEEWQRYVLMLLRRHYAPGTFQEVPDKHKGDYGLEGFSLNGCVYQCYAAEEPLSTQALHEKQRVKLARDVSKFIDNAKDLARIFGDLKISRWILVVPRYESAPLLKHAEKMADKVRAAKLPYVANDFRVLIITDDQFAIEREQILNSNLQSLRINPPETSSDEINEWAEFNDRLVQVLDEKIAKLRISKPKEFRDLTLRDFIAGQNVLTSLRTDYKTIHEGVLQLKADRERFLEAQSLLPVSSSSQAFTDCLATYKQRLTETIPGVAEFTIDLLASEAVADWLLRCPLDFVEPE